MLQEISGTTVSQLARAKGKGVAIDVKLCFVAGFWREGVRKNDVSLPATALAKVPVTRNSITAWHHA